MITQGDKNPCSLVNHQSFLLVFLKLGFDPSSAGISLC